MSSEKTRSGLLLLKGESSESQIKKWISWFIIIILFYCISLYVTGYFDQPQCNIIYMKKKPKKIYTYADEWRRFRG
jgi:hypothetical protein